MSKSINIEVVGTGCPTCKSLHEITQKAASELGGQYQVEYLTEQDGMKRLMELGLMQSPALVVNGKVAMAGYNPSLQKIKSLITDIE